MLLQRSHSSVAFRQSGDARNPPDVTGETGSSRGMQAGDIVKLVSGMVNIPILEEHARAFNKDNRSPQEENNHASTNEQPGDDYS